jgi:hypothetical protein
LADDGGSALINKNDLVLSITDKWCVSRLCYITHTVSSEIMLVEGYFRLDGCLFLLWCLDALHNLQQIVSIILYKLWCKCC